MDNNVNINNLLDSTFKKEQFLDYILLVDKYFQSYDEDSYIFEVMKAIALIKLDNLEAGQKLLQNVRKMELNSYKLISVGKLLYHYDLDEEAIIYFDRASQDINKRSATYYYLGKIFLKSGDYAQASYYFKECWDYTEDIEKKNKLKAMIDEIDDYFVYGKFIKISYNSFAKFNNIRERYIVYVKASSNLKVNIPYLIYQIENDKAWAFPLLNLCLETSSLNQNKNSGGYFKYVSSSIVNFNINEIDAVISLVDEDEFINILNNLYNYYLTNQDSLKKYDEQFRIIQQDLGKRKRQLEF